LVTCSLRPCRALAARCSALLPLVREKVALVITGPELRTPPVVAPRAHPICTPQLPRCRLVLALAPRSVLPRTRCSTRALRPLRALPLAPAARLRASAGPATATLPHAPHVRPRVLLSLRPTVSAHAYCPCAATPPALSVPVPAHTASSAPIHAACSAHEPPRQLASARAFAPCLPSRAPSPMPAKPHPLYSASRPTLALHRSHLRDICFGPAAPCACVCRGPPNTCRAATAWSRLLPRPDALLWRQRRSPWARHLPAPSSARPAPSHHLGAAPPALRLHSPLGPASLWRCRSLGPPSALLPHAPEPPTRSPGPAPLRAAAAALGLPPAPCRPKRLAPVDGREGEGKREAPGNG
jgi:hypothetical protein